MSAILDIVVGIFTKNGFVMSFLIIGVLSYLATLISDKLLRGRIPGSAVAIFLGLILAYIGGAVTGGEKGIADVGILAGVGVLGDSTLRDFTIIATAYGAKLSEIKKCGFLGVIALLIGILSSYIVGALIAVAFGYTDAASVSTIGAGAVTFVVGPVTGAAIGADSTVIALSVATGLVKSVSIMLLTPLVAKRIGLTTPQAAIVFGGLVGSVSGTSTALASVDKKLVPYGAMIATFYTGVGCLLCPSVLYFLTNLIL
ncbi:MAG: malonate transporter subunit MadM [Clostridia bacterium]|nr:malonate transporter subunit MadM [Clostridia bacterium]